MARFSHGVTRVLMMLSAAPLLQVMALGSCTSHLVAGQLAAASAKQPLCQATDQRPFASPCAGFGLVPRIQQRPVAAAPAAPVAAPASVDDQVKNFLASLEGI